MLKPALRRAEELDVYTQVLQRKDGELYTEAFDRLMADAIPSPGV